MLKQPNFLFIISHDTGRCIGPYGYNVNTPNINQFSLEAIKFNNYFCPAPQCSPSRAGILTGLYPHNHGMIGLGHKGFGIKNNIKTFQMYLQENHYETTLIGLSHETFEGEEHGKSTSGEKLGYDNYIEVLGNKGPNVVQAFKNYMNNRDNNTPFFISVGFEETHRPFDEYENFADNPENITPFPFLKDTPGLRKDISLFNGTVKVLDNSFGEIINFMKENNLLDSTYIIFTTDHGIAFPRCKGTLRDSGLETFLLIRNPNSPIKKEKNQLLCNIDMMPTILELANIKIPENLDGKSFASLITEDSSSKIRDEFFCEMTWHDRYNPMRGIRTKKFKYIKNLEKGPQVYMPADIYNTSSGIPYQEEFNLENKKEELYDLTLDPLELNNIADNPNYSLILKELRNKVDNWMKETNDPILKGKIKGEESKFWSKINLKY